MRGTRKKSTPDRVNVRRGLRTYSIPVDRNGKVPMWAIIQRYQEVGSRGDSLVTDQKVLPCELTPEEIADWWIDPSVCDIAGVDTVDSEAYSVPISIRGRKRKALKHIAVISDKEEADRIKKILAEAFTADELERMSGGRSLIIRTEDRLDECTGYYLRQQDGVPVPQIVLETGTTEDGLVHEAVHHLRVADGRTSFPTVNGTLDSGSYRTMSKRQRDEVIRKEETETVVETVARTKIDPVQSGYYDLIPGKRSREAYLRDQEEVSGSRALKGKMAIRAAEKNYEKSCISRAIVTSNNRRRGRK